MHKQNGFSPVLPIILIILIGVTTFIIWRVWDASQTHQASETQPTTNEEKQSTVPEGYTEYNDPEGKFAFIYPESWEIKNSNLNGALVAFVRPSLKQAIGNAQFYDGPSYSLIVSHWANVNEIVTGEEYQGKREYVNLTDYLNDPNTPSKKLVK